MDFLESLLGTGEPPTSQGYTSIEELQLHLKNIVAAKVSPTKSEHIRETIQLQSTTVFSLTLSDTENNALSTVASLDPSLGGSSAIAPAQALGNNQYLRQVGANAALTNQPQDDPVIQRAVAKHIIGVIGQVDGSTWVVRSMARDAQAQGWTFLYQCKDSMDSWLRQNAKGKTRPVVGESSGKDGQDPVNLSRPAFDCRGSVTISFIKANKAISVKYGHTCFHKTVAQLMELFAPPPTPVVSKPLESAKKKSNKRKRASQAADGSLPENGVEAGPSTPSKRAPPKKKRKSAAAGGTPQGQGATAEASATLSQPTAAPAPLLNLPPGEEERRREVANKLLSDKDINPKSLSPDQFNIFANQSPELQQESLAMLVRYGAERLQIVHPAHAQASPQPATPAKAAADGSVASTPATAAAGQTSSLLTPADEDAEGGQATPTSARGKQRKPRVTRGKCEGCKVRKIKCTKEKPTCTQCEEAGNPCRYALRQTKSESEPGPKKRRSRKSAAVVDDADDAEDEDEEADANDMTQQMEETSVMEESAEASVADASEPEPEPEPEPEQSEAEPAVTSAAPVNHFANAEYAWDQSHAPGHIFQSNSAHHHAHEHTTPNMQYPDPNAHSTAPAVSEQSYSTTSLSAGAQRTSSSAATNDYWGAGTRNQHDGSSNNTWTGAAPRAATSELPSILSYQQQQQYTSQAKTSQSKSSHIAETSQTFDGLQQASLLAQAGAQRSQQPSPSVNRSPFQAAASVAATRTRRGQKSQSRSPVVNASTTHVQQSAKRSALPDAAPPYSAATTSTSTAATTYSPYSRHATTVQAQPQAQTSSLGYDTYSNQSTAGSFISFSGVYQNQYNSHTTDTSTPTYTRSATQANSSAHRTSTPSNWSSANNRNAPTYTNSQDNSLGAGSTSTSSYNLSSAASQPQQQAAQTTQHSMHTRQRSSGRNRASNTTSSYDQQQQQQQQQQQANPYSLRPTTQTSSSGSYNMMHQNLQLQQPQQQQDDWYGGYNNGSGNKAAKNSSATTGYGSHGGAYDQSQHHQQQRQGRSMNGNIHGHPSYGGNMDTGDQTLYDLLRGNQQH